MLDLYGAYSMDNSIFEVDVRLHINEAIVNLEKVVSLLMPLNNESIDLVLCNITSAIDSLGRSLNQIELLEQKTIIEDTLSKIDNMLDHTDEHRK